MIYNYTIDTDQSSEEEDYLKFLLMEDIIFCNNGHWDEKWPKDCVSLHVNCNDIFAWATADAEDVKYGELKELFEMVVKDINFGSAAWCIKKRKQMPQAPVEKDIRKAGIWNLEELVKG